MTSQNNDALQAGQQPKASNFIVVQLRRGGNTPEFAREVSGFIDSMAEMPRCTRYALAPDPTDSRTWLIQGDWSCPQAMAEHFESAPLQALIGHLCSLFVYRMEFSCKGPVG